MVGWGDTSFAPDVLLHVAALLLDAQSEPFFPTFNRLIHNAHVDLIVRFGDGALQVGQRRGGDFAKLLVGRGRVKVGARRRPLEGAGEVLLDAPFAFLRKAGLRVRQWRRGAPYAARALIMRPPRRYPFISYPLSPPPLPPLKNRCSGTKQRLFGMSSPCWNQIRGRPRKLPGKFTA